MVISMLKIRRPLGRLIFNMGIATPGKTVFLIETAPWIIILLEHWARFLCVTTISGLMRMVYTIERRLLSLTEKMEHSSQIIDRACNELGGVKCTSSSCWKQKCVFTEVKYIHLSFIVDMFLPANFVRLILFTVWYMNELNAQHVPL